MAAVVAMSALGAWWVAPTGAWFEMLGLVCILSTAAFFTGPFGLLIAFIVVLFIRPGDLIPALAGAGIAKAFAVCTILLVSIEKLLKRDTSWARSHFNPLMAALMVAAVISAVHSTDRAASIAFFTDVYLKIVVLWVLMLNIIDTRARTAAFQVCIALMTSTIAAYGLWARFAGHNLVEGSRSSFVGLMGDPNDLALCLLMSVPFLAEATLHPRLRAKRGFWAVLLVINLAGIVVTQSRGGLLGLAAALYVVMRRRIASRAVTAVLVGVALVGTVMYSGITERQTVVLEGGPIDASARGRIDAWYAGARMFKANPLTGVGLLQATPMYNYYAVNPIDWRSKTSHNIFVQAAAEAGLLGLLPLCMLVLFAFLTDWQLQFNRPRDATPTEDVFLQSRFATLVGMMVGSLFLSVAWSWFPYIVIAQSATAHRVWITMPEVLERHRSRRPAEPEPRTPR